MAGVAETEKPFKKLYFGVDRLKVEDEMALPMTSREFCMFPPWEFQWLTGMVVGARLGDDEDGADEGDAVGFDVGRVGAKVGFLEGATVVGFLEGALVPGLRVGVKLTGCVEGVAVAGFEEGLLLGFVEGEDDTGDDVGF